MGALTHDVPKPLLKIGEHYLIAYTILALKRAGITEIVINISYQGEKIKQSLGCGKQYGVQIVYSEETERLETGGGIFQALPLLGKDPFLVMSGDVITDCDLQPFACRLKGLAHLLMIDNPPYHPMGDFGLQEGVVSETTQPFLTFANVSCLHPALFDACKLGHFRLAAVLKPAIAKGEVTGELHHGLWHNVGTKALLERAREDSNLRPLVSETNTLSI